MRVYYEACYEGISSHRLTSFPIFCVDSTKGVIYSHTCSFSTNNNANAGAK